MRRLRKIIVGLCAPLLFAGAAYAAADGTALLDASRQGDGDAVVVLLNGGADANAAAGDGSTALFWAAQAGDVRMAEALIDAGANVNRANEFGATALYVAATGAGRAADAGRATDAGPGIVEILLMAGADPDLALLSGETPLMAATDRGLADTVEILLAGGADPDAAESKHGQTALMWAASEKYSAIAELLIGHGADVHARTDSGFSALMFAAQQGDAKSGKALLDAGAGVDEVFAASQSTPLLIASAGGHREFVALALEFGADPNAVDANGFTSLHHAAWNRNAVAIVEDLLDHGADPNVRLIKETPRAYTDTGIDLRTATPLLLAAEVSSLGAIQALLDAGADPLIRTEDNTTALLLSAGAGTDFARPRRSDEQEDALAAVKLFVELGVDVNAAGAFGWAPLHAASYQGLNRIVEFLGQGGADLDAMDGFGQTPLSIAYAIITEGIGDAYDQSAQSYRADTAELLLALGATPLERSGVKILYQKDID